MDENQITATDSGPAWWEQTIDFVARAAAMKRFSSPQLTSGQSYYIDQNGNAVPMGQPLPGQMQPGGIGLIDSRLVMLAGLALGAVLLYKLVK